MAVERSNIDRVRVEAQERLDLPDFDALQDTVDDGAQLALGALMGPGGGCLSPFHVILTTAGNVLYMEPTTFQFYWSQKAGTAKDDGTERAWRGGIITYDPLREGQQAKWDYTAYVGQTVYMYARPKSVDAAVDGRRKFVAGAPVSTSVKTRKRAVVEFKFSNIVPGDSSNSGWSSVAVLTGWNGNTPSVVCISAWDSWVAYAQAQQPGTSALPGAASASVYKALEYLDDGADAPGYWNNFLGGVSSARSFGLSAILMQIRARLKRFLDKGGTKDWFEDPTRDFKQLNTDLGTVEAKVAELYAKPKLLVAGFVKYTSQTTSYALDTSPALSIGWTGASPFGTMAFTRSAAGNMTFVIPLPDPALTMLQVLVAPYDPTLKANVHASAGVYRIFISDSQGTGQDASFFVQVWVR